MKQSNWTTNASKPQSFITKGKKRLKQYNDTVYLNNGDEFEVELYNPTQNKVLAKIEMNGKSIGNGIILRPGERVFLERYLDEAKKFLFETYQVEGDNNQVLNAILSNGDIAIKFYDEEITSPFTLTTTGTSTYYPNVTTISNNGAYYGVGSTNTYYTAGIGSTGGFVNTSLTNNITNLNPTYSSNTSNFNLSNTSLRSKKSVETGRVEKGSNSSQTFVGDSSRFKSYATETNWWKILPQSQKMVTREDLVIYCTECGSKRKKDNHKFCPHCGTKF
jgi:ribosomal protein L44E